MYDVYVSAEREQAHAVAMYHLVACIVCVYESVSMEEMQRAAAKPLSPFRQSRKMCLDRM